jgi:hypothetical protein
MPPKEPPVPSPALATLLPLLSAPCSAPQPSEPPGRRIDLTVGRLFVPETYRPDPAGTHLVVHLHGAHWAAEQALVESGSNAVLVSVVLNGLSAVYTEQFRDPAVFRSILAETLAHAQSGDMTQSGRTGLGSCPRIARVTVTSFSAGFGGVRELLKHDDLYARIDALVMADSIHAGFVGDPALRQVDPAAMQGFLRFARAAAAGKKIMVISHSEIRPDTYASTTETADYLLSQLGGTRETCSDEWAPGLTCTSRFERAGFHLFGFTGSSAPDHMQHLYHLALLMQRAEPR